MGAAVLYFVMTLALAGLLAGPLQLLLSGVIGASPVSVTSRCLLLVAFALAPLMLRFRRLSVRAALGLEGGRRMPAMALTGFLLGAATFAPHALMLFAADARELVPDQGAPSVTSLLPRALASGIVVASVEELLFRGVVYSLVRSTAGPGAAIVVSALLYSLAHFLRPEGDSVIAPHWASGFDVIASGLLRFLHPGALAGDFAALFAGGIALGWARHATGNIAVAIGLHACWVTGIKLTRKLSKQGEGPAWLTGSFDGVIGWLAAGWIFFLLLATARVRAR